MYFIPAPSLIKPTVMNSFYFFIIIVILIGAFAGFLAGFVNTFLFLFKITAASAGAYFLYPYMAALLDYLFPVNDNTLFPASFFASVFIIYCIGSLLFIPLKKVIRPVHKYVINKIAGIFPGAGCGIIAVGVLLQFASYFSLPVQTEEEIKNSGFAAITNIAVNHFRDKLEPVFNMPQPSIAAATEKVIPEEASVKLSFVTYSYEVRNDLENQLLQLVNEERIKYGLKKLVADVEMAEVARQHSADMFSRGYFSHNTPDSIDPFKRMHNAGIEYRVAGENLALSSTLALAHKGLMNSPGHRANILNPMYGRVGIGILDGGKYGLMISQEFRD